MYKYWDPTLTILGRLWQGTGLSGGVSFHCSTSQQHAFFIRCQGRWGGSPSPGCSPHGVGGIQAGIVHIICFFWGVGGRACALRKPTTRERGLLTSQLLFHSSHGATHLGEERREHSSRNLSEIKILTDLPGKGRERERETEELNDCCFAWKNSILPLKRADPITVDLSTWPRWVNLSIPSLWP